MQNLQVLRVDGAEVLNLRHLKRLLARAPGPFVRLDLEDDRLIVLDKAAAEEAQARIQARYRVPFLESADLAGAEDDAQLDALVAAVGGDGAGEGDTGAGPGVAGGQAEGGGDTAEPDEGEAGADAGGGGSGALAAAAAAAGAAPAQQQQQAPEAAASKRRKLEEGGGQRQQS